MTTPPAYLTAAHDPTDVIGRRVAALVIDWGIAFVMFVVLSFSLASTREFPSASRAESECDRINDFTEDVCIPVVETVYVFDDGDLAAIVLLPLAYHFLNDALLTGVTGFSLGKGIVGLRVVRQSDGHLAGVGRSMLRWLLWVADAAPYCLPLVGLITALVSKGHRRVGDMAAGTFVVDKSSVGVVPVVPGLTPMAPQWGSPPGWGAPQPPQWGSPHPPQWGAPPGGPTQWGPPPTPQWGPPAAPPPPGPPPPHPQPTWTPPPPTATPEPPSAAPAPSGTPGVDAPLWDDARDTYIQWDPDLAAWVQWDDHAKEWRPIA